MQHYHGKAMPEDTKDMKNERGSNNRSEFRHQ